MKKVPFSCKSSFCLTCAKLYTDQWVEYISRTLFPGVRYRHIVLTVPESLRKYFYQKDDAPEPETGTYKVTGYRERIKKSFGKDPLSCPTCGHEMEHEGTWHPDYGWIVDNWDDLFREEIGVNNYG